MLWHTTSKDPDTIHPTQDAIRLSVEPCVRGMMILMKTGNDSPRRQQPKLVPKPSDRLSRKCNRNAHEENPNDRTSFDVGLNQTSSAKALLLFSSTALIKVS